MEEDDLNLRYLNYIEQLFAAEDSALQETFNAMRTNGLPEINISASQGKLLQVLALAIGAKRILEIGTLGGYSTIWLARALPPDGKIISLEVDPHHAKVARENLDNAGLSNYVEIRVGPGLDSIATLVKEKTDSFDLLFIDADKDNYSNYLSQAFPLVRKGGLILADNTLRRSNLDDSPPSGTGQYNQTVAAREDLVSIVVPALRRRGMDGLTISFKR
ncbi:MAG: O-methyltransferase [Verrucomicrobia bacterium]|nr:O-methyltransferase [Verrucomicrobiota bacterium]